jgi:hypothetical protein
MKTAPTRLRAVCGWTAVLISSAFLGLWAYWGVLENFHEGWYSTSFVENLEVMVIQYFLPMAIFLAAALLAVRAPRIGAIVHTGFAAFALWFFGMRGAGALLIGTPLVGLGVLYWVGRICRGRVAAWLLVGIPVLTSIGFGIAPAWRVFHRVDDGASRRLASLREMAWHCAGRPQGQVGPPTAWHGRSRDSGAID